MTKDHRLGGFSPFRACRVFGRLSFLVFVLGLSNRLLAQVETATLSGTVTDPTGAVVAGAEVRAVRIDTATNYVSTTNSSGIYLIVGLQPGRFRIFVTKQGFKQIELTDVTLNVQDTVNRNFNLEIGAASETVTVRADDLHINTTDAAVSTVVDRQFVENLPLNGRSFQSLISLTPGVTLTKSTGANLGQFSVNGQRSNGNYFTVDGVSANVGMLPNNLLSQTGAGSVPGFTAFGGTNNLVSVDALQEFRIETSTFAPEFGRTPGGEISISTRSGTNNLHGSVFEYFRNDAMDANDWFTNHLGLPKPALRQNDFGFVLGGPVVLPRFGKGLWYNGRSRTFFFLSYEGLRLRQPQVTTGSQVPSLALRQNAVAAVQPFLNAFPVPNGADLGNGLALFSASYSVPSPLDAGSIRIDHTVSKNVTLFARYNYAPSNTTTRSAQSISLSLSNPVTNDLTTATLTAGMTMALGQHLTDDFRINYSRNSASSVYTLDTLGGAVPIPASSLFPSFALSGNPEFQFTLLFGSIPALVIGRTADNVQRQLNVVDNVAMVVGRHRLKFGVDYRRLTPIFGPGSYVQTVDFTNSAQVTTAKPAFVFISAFQSTFPVFNNYSAFAQDSWSVNQRLTLTYGLRWEVNPPPTEANGNVPFTLNGLSNPSTLSLAPRGTPLYETRYANVAPRIGAAYRLFQAAGHETVLRGGYGIFYDLGNGQAGNAFVNFPYRSPLKTLTNVSFPLDESLAHPLDFSTAPSGVQIEVFVPNLSLPRTHQWNVAIEQSLGQNQSLSLTYLGAVGRQLVTGRSLGNLRAGFVSVFVISNAGTSDYHALQARFQRRWSHGLQALASYTWSHSIDKASDEIIGTDLSRGPSDFDVRHNFSAAVTYDIPAPKPQFWAKPLGHWSIDTAVHAQTATPVNVISALSANLNGVLTAPRPNLTPGIPLYLNDPTAPGGRRFNDTVDPTRPGCKGPFCPPAAGQQGNLGRNALRAFGLTQVDFAMRREFPLKEGLNLLFRAEAFNVFNHPNFGDPANLLTNAQFGRATTSYARTLGSGGSVGALNPIYQLGGARSLQLALKVRF